MSHRGPFHVLCSAAEHLGTAAGPITVEWTQLGLCSPNGVLGWARVLDTFEGGPTKDEVRKIHVCYHVECKYRYKHAKSGPPMHVKLNPSRVHTPIFVDAAAGSIVPAICAPVAHPAAASAAAVAGFIGPLAPSGDDAPLTALTAAPQSNSSSSSSSDSDDDSELPAGGEASGVAFVDSTPPPGAPLRPFVPAGEAIVEKEAAGLAPPPVDKAAGLAPVVSTAVAVGSGLSPAVADAPVLGVTPSPAVVGNPNYQSVVLQQVVDLTRMLRRPQAWVGISAFIVFGLCKRLRPFIWLGENRVDILATYYSTAVAVTGECACDVVAVNVERDEDTGVATYNMISADHPLCDTNHFMGCTPCPPVDIAADGSHMETFYLSRGLAPMLTVEDGDCGLDSMCIMSSLPRTRAARDMLRHELADFLCVNAEHHQLMDAMVASQDKHHKILF